jgi:hypothetical protein
MLLKRQNPPVRQRRQRTNFSESQIDYLDQMFVKNPYPDINEREELANLLKTSEDRIQVWFQNKRARYRKKMNKEKNTDIENEKKTKNPELKENTPKRNDSGYQSFNSSTVATPTLHYQPFITFNHHSSSPYPTVYLPTPMFTTYYPPLLNTSPILQETRKNTVFRPYE